ncbi:MAG TPA: sugar transferase [Terriglobales bacterium]|nr:sugar transferase [Terriglobales bacterium]
MSVRVSVRVKDAELSSGQSISHDSRLIPGDCGDAPPTPPGPEPGASGNGNGNGHGEHPGRRRQRRSAPEVLEEAEFQRMILRERKRAERSGKPFLLMLLEVSKVATAGKQSRAVGQILSTLALSTRDTDVTGWYRGQEVVGILFTEISLDRKKSVLATLLLRVSSALREALDLEQFSRIQISFHLFPEEWNEDQPPDPTGSAFYPDLRQGSGSKRWSRSVKRAIDMVCSLLALLLLAPLFALIACAVKLSSPGPVFFRQQRVGQYGARFTFLKFRSMYVNNQADIHKQYVKQLIAGQAAQSAAGVFKITNDPRVTRLGKWLRRASLDELPQFINVLRGEMSLVGPRPPLPYEVEAYDVWHRRRLLEARPGITGLWQVNGRSRTKFDDMVRLDLQYAREQSLLLDLKILLQTPAAVLSGDGAY